MIVAASPAERRPAARPLPLLGVLCALMGFASLSTDFYLPAMPMMGRALGASQSAIEWTVTGYLVGFSLGQLVWGPVGDRFGRKRPIAVGLVLFVLGSAGCGMALSPAGIISWRIVQALGASAGVVLARAMVRDLYSGEQAARMLSLLMTIMAVVPLLGPWLGGQVLVHAGWRWIFWLLAAIGTATGIGLATIRETLPPERRARIALSHVAGSYLDLCRDRSVMASAGVIGTYYLGVYAWVAGTPFAFIHFHGVSAQSYGLLFAFGIAGIMLANMVNLRLLSRFGSRGLVRAGAAMAALAGIATAVGVATGIGGLWGLFVPGTLFASAAGLLVANAIALAMSEHPGRAGAVSALIGSIQYGGGMLGSALIGLFANGTPMPMAGVIAIAGVGAFAGAALLARPRQPRPIHTAS